MFSLIIKAHAEGWVTINGNHVYISDSGKITKGPAKLVGSTVDDIKGQKMTADKKAELQKKYSGKSDSKGSDAKKSETTKSESSNSGSTKSESTSKSTSDRKEELKKKYGDKLEAKKGKTTEEKKSSSPKKSESPQKQGTEESAKKATQGKDTTPKKAEEFSPNRFKSFTEEAKERAERDYQDPVKREHNKEYLAQLYSKGFYSDSQFESVAMDNYGMSRKDYAEIISKAGGKNTLFSDGVAKDQQIRQSTKGSFNSGGESYSYSMDGSYLVVKNSKGVEVAAEKVGVSSLGANAPKTAKSILKATQSNGGNALDVVGYSSSPSGVSNNAFQQPKYPSGIETTAQKRAYTKALNSGKSSSEATKVAKNAGIHEPSSTVFSKPATTPTTGVAGFSKSQNAQFEKLVNSGMSKNEAVSKVLSSGRSKRRPFM